MAAIQDCVRQRYQKPGKRTDDHTESFMSGEALNDMSSSRHQLYVLILQSFVRFPCIHDIVFFRHAASPTGFSKPVDVMRFPNTTWHCRQPSASSDTPRYTYCFPSLLDLSASPCSRMSLKLLEFLGGTLVGMISVAEALVVIMSQAACNSLVLNLNGSMVCEVW